MTTLLFPGRHIVNTKFQEDYLWRILQRPGGDLEFMVGNAQDENAHIDHVVYAITSSNQDHSRYNPVPFHVRAISVDRFARYFREELAVSYTITGIPHFGHSDRFAEHTLKEIAEQTEGRLQLTSENTIVACSTPALIEQYARLGFPVLPVELLTLNPERHQALTPIEVVRRFTESGDGQRPELNDLLSSATKSIWEDFPEVPQRLLRLYRDPLLTEEGSLTETRDYSSYALGMSNQSILQLKYDDIKQAIKPGKIVDEGCADGALLVPLARDFPDSDLMGIEITGEFLARCQERQRAGEYGGTYIHFHQRNLMEDIFQLNSIDTTICNSTLHELWSYGKQEETIRAYLQRKFEQTRRGGRLVIRDVVGPEQKEQEVYLWCNDQDGSNERMQRECQSREELAAHLSGLSTKARFYRFRQDFRPTSRSGRTLAAREECQDGRTYFVLSLQDAVEFLTHKDYVDNWQSELQEEFAFRSFSGWKGALQEAGFSIMENPNHPEQGSRVYSNPWIVDNRWKGKVELYHKTDKDREHLTEQLEPLEYPVTTMVLVGEKR